MHDHQPMLPRDHPHLVVIPLNRRPVRAAPIPACRATDPSLLAHSQDGLLTADETIASSHLWVQQEHGPQGLLVCMRCATSAYCPVCFPRPPQDAVRVPCLACHALLDEVQRLQARLRVVLSCLEARRPMVWREGEEERR